jgi:hypothetical protein
MGFYAARNPGTPQSDGKLSVVSDTLPRLPVVLSAVVRFDPKSARLCYDASDLDSISFLPLTPSFHALALRRSDKEDLKKPSWNFRPLHQGLQAFCDNGQVPIDQRH